MAKVKNQIYDGSELCYTDADERPYGMGEFFRHIMTDAYPLPSLNPSGAVRKSPKGYRPPQQGRGTRKQTPRRACWRQCADRWNALPAECPNISPCPARSSKQNVWNAKQEAGVLSSYYDMYMGCCMAHCDPVTGTIPDDDYCFQCPPSCLPGALSIAYTSQQMQVGQSQTLRAHDDAFGDSVPCCTAAELTWELVSGGGQISEITGPQTTYQAPEHNPGCQNNAVIRLSDCCGRVATLALAINEWTRKQEFDTAVFVGECEIEISVQWNSDCLGPDPPPWMLDCGWDKMSSIKAKMKAYFCDGSPHPGNVFCSDRDCGAWSTSVDCACGGGALPLGITCEDAFQQSTESCRDMHPGGDCPACGSDGCTLDMRTEEMIEAGCCPAELL